MAGRVFGTRAAREQYAANTGGQDVPVYPDLPIELNKLLFEKTIVVNARHDTYAIIIEGQMMEANELSASNWLLRNYGNQLDSDQFAIAQALLITKIQYAIEDDQIIKKDRTKFNRENYLNGDI